MFQCTGDEDPTCADSGEAFLYNQVQTALLGLGIATVLIARGGPANYFLTQAYNKALALKNAHVNYFYDSIGSCDHQPTDPFAVSK